MAVDDFLMKSLFKWLLILSILLVSLYVSSPLWISSVVQSQLPPDWELDELVVAYPGISGINFKKIRLKGETLATAVEVSATNARFNYRSHDTAIKTLSLDVFLFADPNQNEPFKLDQLSLPVIRFPQNLQLPGILIDQLQLKLHPPEGSGQNAPLIMDFDGVNLQAGHGQSFQLETGVSLSGYPGAEGHLGLLSDNEKTSINLSFPGENSASPWLLASFTQEFNHTIFSSQLQLELNTATGNQQQVDRLVNQVTNGIITHLSGQSSLTADFSGSDKQKIKKLSMITNKLELVTAQEKLVVDAGFLGEKKAEKIIITQIRPTYINFQSVADGLLAKLLPQLQHPTEINQSIDLNVSDFLAELKDQAQLELISARGLLELQWQEKYPFVYVSPEINLGGDSLTLSALGEIRADQEHIGFQQRGDMQAQIDNVNILIPVSDGKIAIKAENNNTLGELDFKRSLLQADDPVEFQFMGLSGFGQVVVELSETNRLPHKVITATKWPSTLSLSSKDGQLISQGESVLELVNISIANSSIDVVKSATLGLLWKNLDLLNLSGNVKTKTQGLRIKLDEDLVQGFDIDLTNTLFSDADIQSSGKIELDNGAVLPVELNGNFESGLWRMGIKNADIDFSELGDLLSLVQVQLPEGINLTDGNLGLSAEINFADEVSAELSLEGQRFGLSMLDNTALGGDFSIDAIIEDSLSYSGPVAFESLNIAGGVELRNISAELSTDGVDALIAKQLQAEVFGGQLALASLRYAKNRINDSVVEFIDIDLYRLLAFIDIDDLKGEGLLNIILPLGSDSGGIFISDGTFSSTVPGKLVYKSGVSSSNIGLQALDNFHYQSLSGTLNYLSDGNYQILIALNGNNPDLFDGYPISFKLNIDGVLPELFEALFVTGSFEDGIIKQIRSK